MVRPKYDIGQWVQTDSGRFGKIYARELIGNRWCYTVNLAEKFNIIPSQPTRLACTEEELVPKEPPRVNQVEFTKWKRSQDKLLKEQARIWKEKLDPGTDGGPRSGGSPAKAPRRETEDGDPYEDMWDQLDLETLFNAFVVEYLGDFKSWFLQQASRYTGYEWIAEEPDDYELMFYVNPNENGWWLETHYSFRECERRLRIIMDHVIGWKRRKGLL